MFKRNLIPIAFIIATKDRPVELHRTLQSISEQFVRPDEIVIVDGGNISTKDIVQSFSDLNIIYHVCKPPSATRQRNLGIEFVGPRIQLIGFLDDDIVLEPSAIANMIEFWQIASPEIGGVAFNLMNQPPLFAGQLKRIPFVEKLGFYSNKCGRVLSSGFHTMIEPRNECQFVQWLPTTAVLFRREVLESVKLDEWYKGYSYLEDLDFSYRIGKRYKLAVAANARYKHFPGSSGRGNPITFGKREVINRLYFVRKNRELSLLKCYTVLHLRILINISQGISEGRWDLVKRAWGNIVGLASSFFLFSEPNE